MKSRKCLITVKTDMACESVGCKNKASAILLDTQDHEVGVKGVVDYRRVETTFLCSSCASSKPLDNKLTHA